MLQITSTTPIVSFLLTILSCEGANAYLENGDNQEAIADCEKAI